ncbi:MAG: Holliday junction branch migration protein RuvA, partial [Patescibacteria group bacterium]
MLYSLSGKIIVKKSNLVVLETNGIGFKVAVSQRTSRDLPKIGKRAKLFCVISVSRDNIDLYGFSDEKELEVFEMLNGVNGIGPKSALGILSGFPIERFLAAVSRGRSDLLAKAWGVGRKKAERIILELKDKIKGKQNEELLPLMEADKEVEAALKKLGYKRSEIYEAVKNLPPKTKKTEERLKLALRFLSKR